MKVSNLTKLSVVLRSDLKPDWNRDIWLLDSKNQVSLLFIILSSVLHRRLVKAIGLYLLGSAGSFPGLGIGIMVAKVQSSGNFPVVQM